MTTEEPSYLAFARAAVRNKETLSHVAVGGLVDRIDRDASALKAAQPRTISTVEELDALELGATVRDDDDENWELTDDGWRCWKYGESFESGELSFPATVLYEPQP